jgi:hypothetical protein
VIGSSPELAHAADARECGARLTALNALRGLPNGIESGKIDKHFLQCTAMSPAPTRATFACLEQAYHNRDVFLVFLHLLPEFRFLQGDPRFTNLLRRIGLPVPGVS